MEWNAGLCDLLHWLSGYGYQSKVVDLVVVGDASFNWALQCSKFVRPSCSRASLTRNQLKPT
jgi:hypothetical protein